MNTTRVIRPKLLALLSRYRHRYGVLRFACQCLTLAILAGVPATGLARVDLWRGEHRLLFGPAQLRPALAGVIVGIAATYVLTFLANVVAGRLFCGWGCPAAQIARFAERLDTPRLTRRARLAHHARVLAFGAILTLAMMAWWVDLRVMALGSVPARVAMTGVLLAGTGVAWLHGCYWRWGFCRSACPIGLYYSFVAPARYFGVHFRNQAGACIDCHACDHVCPVDLDPRDLDAPVTGRGGCSLPDAPGFNHCLECGDCVRACEHMVRQAHGGTCALDAPLHLGYFRGPQRIDAAGPAGLAGDADASRSAARATDAARGG